MEAAPDDLSPFENATTAAHLDFIAAEIHRQQEREADRERGAQARLTALLGLSSTLIAVVTALIGFGVASERIDVTPIQLAALLLILGYLALQFVAAMYHTARGLLPREYTDIHPAALDPNPGEQADAFRVAILSTHRSNLLKTRWATNRRLDDMSCAIRAFQNAARGAGALLFVVGLTILNQQFGVCLPTPWT